MEGGYVDHPDDPGGPTRHGITLRTLTRARGRPVSPDEVRALGRAEAEAIYRTWYWDAIRGDDLPAGIDLAVFDAAVNAGPPRAARLLQEVLGLPADGTVGPVTLAACRDADAAALIRALGRARLDFLRRLRTWPVFGRGWRRRVRAVERRALALARGPAASPFPPSTKGPFMFDSKSILASRTVWANLVGLAAVALGTFGLDTSGLDAAAFADAAVQLIAAGSFIASTVFRIVATKQLLA
jgi:lysozyme family protein